MVSPLLALSLFFASLGTLSGFSAHSTYLWAFLFVGFLFGGEFSLLLLKVYLAFCWFFWGFIETSYETFYENIGMISEMIFLRVSEGEVLILRSQIQFLPKM